MNFMCVRGKVFDAHKCRAALLISAFDFRRAFILVARETAAVLTTGRGM